MLMCCDVALIITWRLLWSKCTSRSLWRNREANTTSSGNKMLSNVLQNK